MLIWLKDKKTFARLGDGIDQLGELVGNAGTELAPLEVRRHSEANYQMSSEDFDAWREVIGDAQTFEEACQRIDDANWTI